MEKGNKRGNFYRIYWIRTCSSRKCCRTGKYLRFPYLAVKDGGGTFILVLHYFGTDLWFYAVDHRCSYRKKNRTESVECVPMIHPKWGGLGILACIIPVVILPYYCSIGGWVLKYLGTFITGHGVEAAQDGYFTGYITSVWQPIIWLFIYLFLTAFVVYRGVNKGIENYSRIPMPILLIMIVGISIFR